MFGPFESRFNRFNRFSPGIFPGFFPGFGFGGVLPSYYPYLVANGFGRSCGPCFPSFSPFAFSPFITPFSPYPFRY
jgi:hypothetical protein